MELICFLTFSLSVVSFMRALPLLMISILYLVFGKQQQGIEETENEKMGEKKKTMKFSENSVCSLYKVVTINKYRNFFSLHTFVTNFLIWQGTDALLSYVKTARFLNLDIIVVKQAAII